MKDERFLIAGNGLKLMFLGEVISLFSFVPLLGGLATIVGAVLAIIGLVKTIRADGGYQRALVMLVLTVACSVLMVVFGATAVIGAAFGSGSALAGGALAALVLGIGASVFSFLMTYFVCTTTSGLLREIGLEQEAGMGDLVWKLNALCYLLTILISVVSFLSSGAAGFLTIFSSLISLAAGIIYVVFLYKSYNLMLA